jgi:hypothetical protein
VSGFAACSSATTASLKRSNPTLSLAVLFLAVQFLDVLFSLFVLIGVEKMRIVHGFTAFNPYDLFFMPYSHSLLGALVWSAVFAVGFLVARRRDAPHRRILTLAVLAAAVFSHFVLDVPVHTPDLPLGPGAGSTKIGLGLWNHRAAAIAAELAVLCTGGVIYLRATRSRSRGAGVATVAFSFVLVVATVATPFMPDPPSGRAFAVQALVFYALLALAAGAIDRRREPQAAGGSRSSGQIGV